jgi:hypothetical protein
VSAPSSRRWRRLVVVVATLGLAVITAASAPALYGVLAGEPSDFVRGEPAPAAVAERLADEGTAERLTPFFTGKRDVIAEAAHGVAAIETAAGRAILWAATPQAGPICYFVEFEALTNANGEPRGEAKCGTRLSAGAPTAIQLSRPVVDGRELVIVVGWAHESVASVILRSPEGDESELPLSERFFMAEVPAERVPKVFSKGETYDVIARDRAGADLHRWPVAGVARPLFFNPKVTGPKRTVIDTTDSRGRPMQLSVIPIEGGETCVELETRNGTRTGCGRARTDDAVQVRPTLMGSMVYVSGSVGLKVAKLELHHQDGFVLELPIIERFVLHDIPRARLEDGKRPVLLVARDRAGAELAREKVAQTAFRANSAIWSGENVSP